MTREKELIDIIEQYTLEINEFNKLTLQHFDKFYYVLCNLKNNCRIDTSCVKQSAKDKLIDAMDDAIFHLHGYKKSFEVEKRFIEQEVNTI